MIVSNTLEVYREQESSGLTAAVTSQHQYLLPVFSNGRETSLSFVNNKSVESG